MRASIPLAFARPGMLDTCDLSPGGTKAEAAARLIDFLEAPHDSGKKSLVAKAGQKRKAAEKKAP